MPRVENEREFSPEGGAKIDRERLFAAGRWLPRGARNSRLAGGVLF